MVEKIDKQNTADERPKQISNNLTVAEITHYPKDGGVKTLSFYKDSRSNGGLFVRLAYYDKSKNISDVQVMKLDDAEVSHLALSLLREVLNR